MSEVAGHDRCSVRPARLAGWRRVSARGRSFLHWLGGRAEHEELIDDWIGVGGPAQRTNVVAGASAETEPEDLERCGPHDPRLPVVGGRFGRPRDHFDAHRDRTERSEALCSERQ
jgi:hypothetical protein